MNNRSTTLAKPAATELATTPNAKTTSGSASSVQKPTAPTDGKSPTDDAIRLVAYSKWEAAGKPTGDGVNFWLQSEIELRQTLAAGERNRS